jgi:gamma-glutamyltranspeptidase/glutathione hydrolase
MAVSQNSMATRVGQDILSRGGNAVDAAVAMGFALAVTLPRAGNLGGSGFMLLHMANEHKTEAIDYRSVAPLAASVERYTGADGELDWDKLTWGPMAAGVPGTVAGMYMAWQRHGSMEWKELLLPAWHLASEGFEIHQDLANVLNMAANELKVYATGSAYLKQAGQEWATGDKLVQPDLAWSIAQIMELGASAFYEGELSQRIVAAFKKNGGLLSSQDLAAYKARERVPVSTTYRDKQVVSMPPVSSGGVTLVQMLNILNNFDLRKYPQGSAKSLHLLAEVMKRAAANRRTYLGDPDFVELPIDAYIDQELAREMAGKIDMDHATRVADIGPESLEYTENRDTTHFSVMDQYGNAVSNTYTLGYSFGSGFVAEGTGILFDNQMRNFSYRADSNHPNALAPGKRMLSTMTPTIVLDQDGKVFLVTGTPGGGRIINVILQVLVNVIDYQLNIAEASDRPRIHQGWQQEGLAIETGMNPEVIGILRNMGHEIDIQKTMGSTQSIVWRGGVFEGSADPRRPNALALGLDSPPAR